MATIVNERDKLLQAAPTRLVDVTLPSNIIPESVKGITLTPTTGVFKTTAAGVTTPTDIVYTLNRKHLTNAATWTVVEGTATLSGTGDTRTLANASMSSDKITIQAQVVEGGKTYTTTATSVRVKDGISGTNGAAGQRGTQDLYVIGSSWSDSVANNAILSATGSSLKYAGDKVTIYNNAGFAETRYWDGVSSWTTGQIINGNMLVTGTVTSNAIGTNVLSAVNIETSGRIRSTGSMVVGGDLGGQRASVIGFNLASGENGVCGYSGTGAGVYGYCKSTVGGSGVFGQGYYGGSFTTNLSSGVGCRVGNITGNVALQIEGKVTWTTSGGGAVTWNKPDNSGTKFLRDDGVWAAPGASSGVTSFNSRTGAVTLNSSDVSTAVAGATLAINVTGNAGSATTASNANALGGLPPSSWVQFVATTTSSKTFAGYMLVQANGTTAYIPLYV